MRKNTIYVLLLLLWCSVTCSHARNWWDGNRVSPLYFGPNSLPVPDMLDGRVSPKLYAELAGDLHVGFYGDMTETVSAKVNIPLFTPRVNLTVWMPVIEFYQYTPEALAHFQPREYTESGHQVVNVYVSVDIHVFKERRIMPDISVRAAIITASGDGDEYSRYFDAPGYFFDASVGKSFRLGEGFFRSVRVAASAGFLCWQVTQTTQNDAVMYGAMATLSTSVAELTCAWQGYSGWIGNGDRPMVLKAVLAFPVKGFRPLLAYEYGLRDWPFHHFRIGLGYTF